MNKIFGSLLVIVMVVVLLPLLQTCNVPSLQAQAMIEQARASSEIAEAAQQAANSANTLAWTLGGSVALLTLGLVSLIGFWIFVRVRRELNPAPQPRIVPQPQILPRSMDQAPQLGGGVDPMQALIQLQTLQMLQNMNQRNSFPAPRLPAPQEWEEEPVDDGYSQFQ